MLEVVLEVRNRLAVSCPARVSILILLEVVLEEGRPPILVIITLCFNPYFAGSSSGRTVEEVCKGLQ